jgi:hypothetical protein
VPAAIAVGDGHSARCVRLEREAAGVE